ncbi:MAG: hypothetical protein FJ179_09725 [Gammaproteobacteria bacterium]|nr:hypothetical protein [Gammaproteobacteria bacterium]
MHSRSIGQRSLATLAAIVFTLATLLPASLSAGPAYDQTRPELEAVLADLIAWLPGDWDSYPQVHFERRYRVPAEGEHEHWYRVFERIDAPQIGDVVFYGQINSGGRDGPLMHRTQILYKVWIDEKRGAVVINGQPPLNAEKYTDLHLHPALWGEVQMRDPEAINCDFLLRRDGEQIFGVLDGKTDDRRTEGPGTCSYMVNKTDIRFVADAEWVFTPENLWVYDINLMAGHQFVGRKDRTHIRMSRARNYDCKVIDWSGERSWSAYDRGATLAVKTKDGRKLQLMLLRAHLPDAAGKGMFDRLHFMVQKPGEDAPLHDLEFAPRSAEASMIYAGVEARCALNPTRFVAAKKP